MKDDFSSTASTSPPRKQTRASRPKVRTGCKNCKQRKVKCDEKKPYCDRCDKAKIQCEGYGIFINVGPQHQQQQLLPQDTLPMAPRDSASATDTFIFYRGLNALSELTEFENASYDFARQRTTVDLSTLQCPHFWNTSVLAGCHSDPAILHAVLALGAAHRSFTITHSMKEPTAPDPFSRVAYTHYGKAIKHLQARLTINDPDSYRLVLIICIILLSFDLLQQRFPAALMHLHHGRHILRMLYGPKHAERDANILYLPPRTQCIDEELVYGFSQIDLQSTNWGSGRPQFTLVDSPDKSDPSDFAIPETFVSVDDAGRYIMILMNDCWRLTGIVPDRKKLNRFNTKAVAHQHRLLASLKRWEQAFCHSKLRPSPTTPVTDPDIRKALILQIHHALITIVVSTSLCYPDQIIYDSLLACHTTVVTLAGRILPHLPIFNLDLAIIQPLYNTAIHCRHPVIRRQAIDMLQLAGREGLWDSKMCETLAREVIRIEEEHSGYHFNDEVAILADVNLAEIIPARFRIAENWMFFIDEEDQTMVRLVHKRKRWSEEHEISNDHSDFFDNEDYWEVIEHVVPVIRT